MKAWLHLLWCVSCVAQSAPPVASLSVADLPVREATVFKDGHAYLLREAALPSAQDHAVRQVVLDDLPAPLLGTFWPYATGGAKVRSARAGMRKVLVDEPAVDLRKLAVANIGREVVLVGEQLLAEGKLLDVPAATLGEAGELAVLETKTGVQAIPLSRVRELQVRGDVRRSRPVEQSQPRLTIELEGVGKDAVVGVSYVQRGLRWLPGYRIELDGNGQAACRLQATLENDLIDLRDATLHLVVGVPSFLFAEHMDPIALQKQAAAVAAQMRGQAQQSQFSNFLSNSVMTQTAGFGQQLDAPAASPAVAGEAQHEDLFVFTLEHVTLQKGERMVVPVVEFALRYRDIYTLKVPFGPPNEVRQNLQSERVLQLARELAAPKAMHVLRLTNGDERPLTTAPTLVLRQGRVLAQGRMRYTPRGMTTDLEINPAMDLAVQTEEREVGRGKETKTWDGDVYGRVDLAGSIKLTNGKAQRVELEVVREVLGLTDTVGQDGNARQLDLAALWHDGNRPAWWSWWNCPYWWFRWNGFGAFRWQVALEPGATLQLDASWHYFWR